MEFASVWDEAGSSVEAEIAQRSLAQAKVASASLWPFLALAKDSAEFGQRLDLVGDDLSTAASAHGVEPTDLVAAYTREYRLLAESRKVAYGDPDGTQYGAQGDHCPHCGSDWKQGCDPDCLRENNPERAEQLEDAAEAYHAKNRSKISRKTAGEKNVWGTEKSDVDPDYCPDCEREGGGLSHYDNCPQYKGPSHTSGKLPDALKEHQFKAADETEDDETKEASRRTAAKPCGEWINGGDGMTCPQPEGHAKEHGPVPRLDRSDEFAVDFDFRHHQGSRRTADVAWNAPPAQAPSEFGPDSEGMNSGEDWRDSDDEPDERTSHERWGDSGDGHGDPGDAQDRHYPGDYSYGNSTPAPKRQIPDYGRGTGHGFSSGPAGLNSPYSASLHHIKVALEEGVDPLSWIEGEDGGQGQPEKPVEAGIEAAGVPTQASRHPFFQAM